MRLHKIILALLYWLCLCINAGAQALNTSPNLPLFKQIGHSLMPAISSEYFFFSQDGLLWFSTAEGLTSFDGSEIVYYNNAEETFSYGFNKIKTIAEDSIHNLYIGAGDKIVYFDRSKKHFTLLTYKFAGNIKSSLLEINSLFIDKSGLLYAGFSYKGLLIYNAGKNSFENIQLDFPPKDTCLCDNIYFTSVLSFAADLSDTNKLWLGTYNGIVLYNKRTKQMKYHFKVANPAINKFRKMPFWYDIRKMDIQNDSIIWFSTASFGFGRYNMHSGIATLFIHNARIKQPELWKAYTLKGFAKWGTEKYVLGITTPAPGLFNTRNGYLELFNVVKAPDANDDVEYITNDNKGNVWILIKGQLFASKPDYFYLKATDIEKQLTHDYLPNQFGGIFFDKKLSLYYASVVFSSGVYVLDTNFKIVKIIPAPLFTNSYTYKETSNEFITIDGSNRIWTSCVETYILKPGASAFEHAEKISQKLHWLNNIEEVLGVYTRRNGNVLLRTFDNCVYDINHKTFETDTITIAENENNAEFEITTTIQYDSSRDILYFNNKKVICQYQFSTRKKTNLDASLLLGNVPMSNQTIQYALDGKGRIWICTPNYGIRIIDPDKLTCIDSIPFGKRGLLPGSFSFMCNGGKTYMFLMGQSGIVIYDYTKRQSFSIDDPNGINNRLPYFTGQCNNYLFTNKPNRILYFNLANVEKFNFIIQPLLNSITQDNDVIFTRGANDKNVTIPLKYYQNSLSFSFSAQEFFFPEKIEYAYQLKGVDKDWQHTNSFNRKITYSKLKPGHYTFRLQAQTEGCDWHGSIIEYVIIISPPFWQTWWFLLLLFCIAGTFIFYIAKKRIEAIRSHERIKSKYEKELLELEAKALRAQMNPHFIFNCMNSIKSLIQQQDNDGAVNYLTTFSKLIRTIFQNSDKREISLYDEIETCRLYTQLESLRFNNKFKYQFHADGILDLKSVMVPALIIQPFIENAIWHGIMPKADGGTVSVSVNKINHLISCIIDDDGIGRDMSKRNKFKGESSSHQSKGVHLTQVRLNLDNLLNERSGSVEIIDKKNEVGKPAGTTVIITFSEY